MSISVVDTEINRKTEKTQKNSSKTNILYRILLTVANWVWILFWFLLPILVGLLISSLFTSSRGVEAIDLSSLNRGFFDQQAEKPKFVRNNTAESSEWIEKCSHLENVCSEVDLYFNPEKQNKIKEYLLSPDSYLNKNFIFHGEPGTGKSYCALQIARAVSSSCTIIAGRTLQRVYVGSGASSWLRIIKDTKEQAKNATNPVVVIVEEIGSLIDRKKITSSSDHALVDTFLESVDSIRGDNIIIIGTTNTIDFAEPAVIRDGRLRKVHFGYPSRLDMTKLIAMVKSEIESKYRIKEEEADTPNSQDHTIIIPRSYWKNLDDSIERSLFRRKTNNRYPITYAQIFSAVERMITEKVSSDSSPVPKFDSRIAYETTEYLLISIPYSPLPFNLEKDGYVNSSNSYVVYSNRPSAAMGNSGESRGTLYRSSSVGAGFGNFMVNVDGKRKQNLESVMQTPPPAGQEEPGRQSYSSPAENNNQVTNRVTDSPGGSPNLQEQGNEAEKNPEGSVEGGEGTSRDI